MNIHQLSVSFDPLQDRVLLRVNTTTQEELQVWLTRRMVSHVLPILLNIARSTTTAQVTGRDPAADETSPTAGSEHPPPGALGASDFATPYQPAEKNLLDGAPMLLTDLSIQPQSDGLTLLQLQEKIHPEQPGRVVELRLKAQMVQGLTQLLHDIWLQSGWSSVGEVPQRPAGLNLEQAAAGQWLN